MTPPPRGRLVAVEGIDGSGKSTQARRLAADLRATLTHEPGATNLGRALRRLLLDGDHRGPVPRAEALLMAADRAQHVDEVLRPALAAGRWVVTDRFTGSTLAYQGWGRGLGGDELRPVVVWAAGGIEADLSVLLDVPYEVARRRRSDGAADRLERLGPDFFARVREGYAALARADPEGWVVVDGAQPADAVAVQVAAAVRTRLGWPAVPAGAGLA